MNKKPISYSLSVDNLKRVAIDLHLAYLHNIHEQMIEEALEKSDYSEARAVIQNIMEKK